MPALLRGSLPSILFRGCLTTSWAFKARKTAENGSLDVVRTTCYATQTVRARVLYRPTVRTPNFKLGGKVSPTDISYIAGLLDGEGCIQIRKGKSSGWSCYISISNTNRECLEFVQLRFGGHIYGSPKKNSNYIVYQWNIRSLKAMEFAKAVKPFSIIKRKQLETFLRVERTFTGCIPFIA